MARALELPEDSGAIVADVDRGGPGGAAGLRIGDIVLTLDGKPIENGRQLDVNLYSRAAGDVAQLEFLRGGQRVQLPVAVAERQDDPLRFAEMVSRDQHLIPRLGVLALTLTDTLREAIGAGANVTGALVAARAGERAAEYGIQPGDLVVSVNRVAVKELDDFRQTIARLPANTPCALQVLRQSQFLFLAFELGSPMTQAGRATRARHPVDGAAVAAAYDRADAARWQVSREAFAAAVAIAVEKRFEDAAAAGRAAVEAFIATLHAADLAPARACRDGHSDAWDDFAPTYRPELYRAARAIAGEGGRELADSLYGELFGLAGNDGDAGRAALLPGAEPARHVVAQRAGHGMWTRSGPRGGSDRSTIPTRTCPSRQHPPRPSSPRGGPDARRRRVPVGGHRAARRAVRLRLAYYYVHGLTLAEAGRLFGEHEATASRKLEKARGRRGFLNGAGRPGPADERRGELGRGRAAGLGRGVRRGSRRRRPRRGRIASPGRCVVQRRENAVSEQDDRLAGARSRRRHAAARAGPAPSPTCSVCTPTASSTTPSAGSSRLTSPGAGAARQRSQHWSAAHPRRRTWRARPQPAPARCGQVDGLALAGARRRDRGRRDAGGMGRAGSIRIGRPTPNAPARRRHRPRRRRQRVPAGRSSTTGLAFGPRGDCPCAGGGPPGRRAGRACWSRTTGRARQGRERVGRGCSSARAAARA